jgi:uncharacterized membrane protein YdbT with pleckstrin-like domain
MRAGLVNAERPLGRPVRARRAAHRQPSSALDSVGLCANMRRRIGVGEGTMSYIAEVLQPGEVIRYETTLSWTVYLTGILLLVLALVVYLIWPQESYRFVELVLLAILIVAGLISLAYGWFKRWTTEIAVTDRRVTYKKGFIARSSIEMHMDKVESVDVKQSVLGRILNYGDVTIRGTGDTWDPLPRVDSPLELRNHITGQ